jgi:hypothetical protein
MKKSLAAALGSIAAFVTAVLVAPTAHAFTPPEPANSGSTPVASIETGSSLLSWQTASVALIAVAVGVVIAVVAGRLVHRSSRTPALSS